MAFTEGNQFTSANASSTTTILAAPAASTRRIVRTITVFNTHTSPVSVTLQFDISATDRRFISQTLNASESLVWDSPLVLDSTTEIIEIVVGAGAAQEVTVHYGDVV